MIKAVIFDMDGLLIDSEPLWARAHRSVFKPLGIKITDEDMQAVRGMKTQEAVERHCRKYSCEGYSAEELAESIYHAMIAMVKSEGVLLPGVHQALRVCKKAGLLVAIASSSPMKLIDAVVETLEIREHFDHIYSAQFEPYGKPHPGVFIKVAEHFKVAPVECLVFEDSPSGVLAAKAARMKCIAVPEPEVRDNPFVRTADIIIGSLEEFDEVMLTKI